MRYTMNSGPIKVNIPAGLLAILENENPTCLTHDSVSQTITIEQSDEGFDIEDIEAYLKCATSKGKFIVRMEDSKGSDHFYIKYGPGFCTQED